jgi:hypothetical protein
MEPKEATHVTSAAAAVLAQAMSKTTDAVALKKLAWGLAPLAARLDLKDAADLAAIITSAISQTKSSEEISDPWLGGSLTEALTAVLKSDRPEHFRRAVAVAGVVGTFPAAGGPVLSLGLLGPAVEPPSCRLSTQQLVDLLKLPTCQDPARRVVLDYLGYRYHRSFRNHWEFVEYARGHLADLDLTSPPQRPRR